MNKKQVDDNILDWFRNEFVPKASELTIASLIFLYDKYSPELKEDKWSLEFLKEKVESYKSTPVNREEMIL